MPALPELLDAAGEIRHVEISRQLIAKAARTADGHVGITGEVTIELYRVPHDGQQHRSAAELHGVRIHRVYENSDIIRDNYLFEKAEQEYLHTLFEIYKGDIPVLTELRQKLPRLHDRSGDELREKRDIKRKLYRASLRLDLPAVDVDNIAERLEGVERNADRQQQLQRSRLRKAEKLTE